METNWWLAEKSQYGHAIDLVDGPHSDRKGVEEALYLIQGLGLAGDKQYCCVKTIETDVEPKDYSLNKEYLAVCKTMIDQHRKKDK